MPNEQNYLSVGDPKWLLNYLFVNRHRPEFPPLTDTSSGESKEKDHVDQKLACA